MPAAFLVNVIKSCLWAKAAASTPPPGTCFTPLGTRVMGGEGAAGAWATAGAAKEWGWRAAADACLGAPGATTTTADILTSETGLWTWGGLGVEVEWLRGVASRKEEMALRAGARARRGEAAPMPREERTGVKAG